MLGIFCEEKQEANSSFLFIGALVSLNAPDFEINLVIVEIIFL